MRVRETFGGAARDAYKYLLPKLRNVLDEQIAK